MTIFTISSAKQDSTFGDLIFRLTCEENWYFGGAPQDLWLDQVYVDHNGGILFRSYKTRNTYATGIRSLVSNLRIIGERSEGQLAAVSMVIYGQYVIGEEKTKWNLAGTVFIPLQVSSCRYGYYGSF